MGRWVGWFGRTDAMGLVLHNNIQYLVSFTTIIYIFNVGNIPLNKSFFWNFGSLCVGKV